MRFLSINTWQKYVWLAFFSNLVFVCMYCRKPYGRHYWTSWSLCVRSYVCIGVCVRYDPNFIVFTSYTMVYDKKCNLLCEKIQTNLNILCFYNTF